MPWVAFDWDSVTGVRRHHLPHVTQPGAVYFITFRLHDSIPADRIAYWKKQFDRWLQSNPSPHTDEQRDQMKDLCFRRVEKYLNGGHGQCCLRSPEFRGLVEERLLHREPADYQLGDYVIMPNHVHVLLSSPGEIDLGKVIGAWKSISAKQINKALGRTGSIWQDEWFDHIVRSPLALRAFREYIRRNPARLPPGIATVGCGSLKDQ